MIAAVINPKTNEVVNLIVADPVVDTVPGMLLVPVPSGMALDRTWRWDHQAGFVPPPEYVVAMAENAKAEAQESFLLDGRKADFRTACDQLRRGDASQATLDMLGQCWGNYTFRFHQLDLLWQHAIACRDPMVDIGTGLSTIVMGIAAEINGTTVIAVEPDATWETQLATGLQTAGLTNVVVAPSMPGLPKVVGLVLVDGALTKEGRARFIDASIAGAATVIIDDLRALDLADHVLQWAIKAGRSFAEVGRAAVTMRI
jgi:hypothetical protein